MTKVLPKISRIRKHTLCFISLFCTLGLTTAIKIRFIIFLIKFFLTFALAFMFKCSSVSSDFVKYPGYRFSSLYILIDLIFSFLKKYIDYASGTYVWEISHWLESYVFCCLRCWPWGSLQMLES